MNPFRILCAMALCFALLVCAPVTPATAAAAQEPVKVEERQEGAYNYVVGTVKIPAPADEVWMVVSNPYEFEQKISPKCHTEEIVKDTPELSVIRARIDVGFFLPPIHYTVESRYEKRRKISFHALGGDLKEFRGAWEVIPTDDGKACFVTFGMFVQPNVPVPQWLVKRSIRGELPRTLTALRDRVQQLTAGLDKPATQKLASTGMVRFSN